MRIVHWQDLVRLSWPQRVLELVLPLPWLVFSLWLFSTPAWPLGLVGSFYFFLTGLRLSHNAQHCCLGLPRWAHDAILAVLSVLMGASMHAVQATHMNHHRHELDEHDVEGAVARLGFPAILFAGPRFLFDLHRFGLTRGSAKQRRFIAAELVAIALVWTAAGVAFGLPVARHEAAMLAGESLTAFFAVWIVHRGAASAPTRARTERSALVNAVTYDMLLHAEHHAYPAVPTPHWGELARRRALCAERVEGDVLSRR